MVEAQNVGFRAGHRDLISGISARFAPGQLHLIIGANGAGKSTLVKVLSRLLRPAAGLVQYDGRDVSHATERDLARRRAVLSQAIEVAFPLSVREVVMMGRYPHFGTRPAQHDLDIVDEVMRFFDVSDMAERSYPTLSGGEKQRVNFARVLGQVWQPVAGQHRILFLDEPLTFLDIRHQIEFMKKVRETLKSGDMVIVGVVHDLNLAARFADRLLLLNQGRVLADGTGAEVLAPAHIRTAFGIEPVVTTAPGGGLHLIFD
ncbi:MAG TPA: heme ABC transporter ATP-binding protein [Vicinamibacterales bacterium]|jgi:iron complex transport system ATP-binding protein|nr:heme ABC transporter ATP-binding protein [Vicinamibacterales bacterium]